ncbi:F-box/LRR-repeat protein 25-like [Rutidosis leptorrhynchoides]|uniref:F-box/LRR-repeat protein 25-like n=1 Tax=Rutidosis leptorrhynchoides TaxID=125765 RepID=UPI003A9A4250
MEKKLQKISQLDDVPVDLIPLIQSLLPVKDAARTCVLSKSWLYAWSATPHLRFHKPSQFSNKLKQSEYMMFMNRTISNYVKDNTPIESFDLKLHIKAASLAKKWIRTVAAQSCLKQLSLQICYVTQLCGRLFMFPDGILSGENLRTLLLRYHSSSSTIWLSYASMSPNPVINCVSLRILELDCVKISKEVLDRLITTCLLLEKITLSYCFLKTYKVRNLRYLQELEIYSTDHDDILIVDDVPGLRLFTYYNGFQHKFISFNMQSLTNVTELSLRGVIIDVAFLEMIESKFPFLKILKLTIQDWPLKRLDFTRFSLKKLALEIRESKRIDLQVYSPN